MMICIVSMPIKAAAPGTGAPAVARCPGPHIAGQVTSIDETGLMTLSGGTAMRLADIRLAAGAAGEWGRAVLESLVGRALRGRGAAADRWNVRPAAAVTDETGIELADLLVAEGLAVVDAGEADALCEPRLLTVEATARERQLGTWRDGGILDGAEAAAMAASVGRFGVIEGRVVSVGERPARTYINLGRAGSGALTITLSKRRWTEWQRAHSSPGLLRGRRVRVRGIVEQWRSPMLDVAAIETLELIEETAQAR